jgi:hypothetical protein
LRGGRVIGDVGGGGTQELNGGLIPEAGTDVIGNISIPGTGDPNINAIAAAPDGTIYAFNLVTPLPPLGGMGQAPPPFIQLVRSRSTPRASSRSARPPSCSPGPAVP